MKTTYKNAFRSVLTVSVVTMLVGCMSEADNLHPASQAPSVDECLAAGADCASSQDCCSFWCVNGACEVRDP